LKKLYSMDSLPMIFNKKFVCPETNPVNFSFWNNNKHSHTVSHKRIKIQ
jgi:hypothetical protein